MEAENSERKMKTPEQLLESKLHAVLRTLNSLGKTRGEHERLIIEAVRERLHLQVDLDCARIMTTQQMPLFEDLAARAEEMRVAGQRRYTDPVMESTEEL